MRTTPAKLILLGLTGLLAFSCSEGSNKKNLLQKLKLQGYHPSAHKEEYIEAMIQEQAENGKTHENQITEVQKGEYIDECDIKLEPMRLEVARFLDKNHDHILRLYDEQTAENIKTDSGNKYEKFGSLNVRIVDPNTSADGWIEEKSTNWPEIHEEYLALKNIDFSQAITKKQRMNLLWIYKAFLGIIVDDKNRTVDGDNYKLRHDSGPVLHSIVDKTQACITENCVTPVFDEKELKMIEGNVFYSWQWNKFKDTNNRERLQKLIREVSYDFGRFDFVPNKHLSSDGKNFIMDLSNVDLADANEQMNQLIQSIWVGPVGEKVSLNFIEPREGLFNIIFENKPGGRSFVRFGKKEIHLLQDVKNRSIAHEIGHALGFLDQYFTLWDPQTCEYSDEYNPADIMADSTGKVLDHHWKKLKEAYVK